MNALLKILKLFEGNKSALAKRIAELSGNKRIVATYVNNWLERDKRVPAEFVLNLAEASAWQVTPHELRPDLYPHPQDGLPEHLREVA